MKIVKIIAVEKTNNTVDFPQNFKCVLSDESNLDNMSYLIRASVESFGLYLFKYRNWYVLYNRFRTLEYYR